MARMTQELVPTTGMELEVSATTPLEMSQAQDKLIAWCNHKIEVMKHEAVELAENLAIAIKNKWKTDTLRRHSVLATNRVTFYEKIKAALEAGYCIVPNFPIDLFAIRTNRKKPNKKWHFGTYEAGSWHFMQTAAQLPVGEGEYKSVHPLVQTDVDTEVKDGATKKSYAEHATDFDDVTFPIQMAKPKIMEATSQAMALKIFDQFGLFAPGTGDPIITGEIVDPRNNHKNPVHMRRVTFIIAWHLNVRDL
jgi:hypothetical protein